MDYFKPHKYIKRPQPKAGRPMAEKVKSQKSKVLRPYIAFCLILLGTSVLGAKVIKPYTKSLALYNIQKPLFSPVLGYKTGPEKDFSFEELKFEELKRYGDKTSVQTRNAPEKFYLTIPKLGIYKAEVKLSDTSLSPDKMLGHYAGTALPGESYNSFIYGHAVFEDYFDPTNYKTMFSTLPKLLAGDTFYINYLDKTYKYVVTMKKTVEPKDVNPYENFYPDVPNNSTVSLMTCVPPGRKDFRLLVIGSLVKQGN